MPDPRAHRVFLSSPGDVQTERDAADAVLTGLQRSAAWRGKFTFDVVRWDDPAAPVPMDAHLTPQQAVDTGRPKPSECDITVVILWSRMGTPLEHQGRRYLSGTEYEYEDARRGEGRLLLYRRTDKPQLDIDDRAFEEKRQQYQSVNQFFERFTAADGTLTGGYTPYEGADAFAPRFRQDIEAILRQVDSIEARPPDIAARSVSPTRFISYSGLPDSGGFLFGREPELKLLDGAWANTSTNVLSLVAWGGVGKSALVNHWLATMAKEHYRGTQRVFGWSFHNQGTRETATSADLFFIEALQQFGDGDPKAGTPKDRAKRLIRLVQEERSLLILDGLEPLQHPPGHGDKGGGDLKDPALATLVRALAADNPGLCILTTRLSIKELQSFIGATALVIELEHLSATAGAALLAALDVQGAQGELEKASTEFGGHSLALNLLGTYLRDICGGDVSRRGEIPLRDEDKEYGGQAWQMLASYEEWFGEGPELEVLRLLGLFDRPAEGKLLDVLRKPPSIVDLTKTLVELKSSDQWQRVLARLRKAGLLAMADARGPDAYDIHPLVREYFSDQVQEKFPEAWREGHSRLYEYLRKETTDLPDDLRGMTALSQVVAHGCHAGRHQEVLDEVYRRRMHREPQAYNQFNLGAIGDDLAAVSCFFESKVSDQPWDQPVAGLAPKSRGYVLNEAGWDLRALGRLTEAIQPMKRAMEVREDAEDWIGAANSAANCSTILLQVGELVEALKYARKGVELAERSDDRSGPWGPQHSYNRAFLGEALHKMGRTEEAESVFRKAERIQEEWDPARPLLYAVLAGFLYCDFLLDQGKYQDVKERALQTLEWNKKEERLRDIALDHLSLGRAILLEALQKKNADDLSEAANQIDAAVVGLFEAKQEDHLLLGLLAQAALRRAQGKLPEAWTAVEKALEIAGEGPMKLHQVDAYLESTRLWLEEGEYDRARKYLVRSKAMIDKMDYHRRDREVAGLETYLAEA